MNSELDLHDVQGNIVKPYGRFGFPQARFVLFQIHEGEAGREAIQKLLPYVTNGAPWTTDRDTPPVAVNLAFTYEGLKQLGVPDLSLHGFPDEFSMGMRARRDILEDTGDSAPEHWDPVWLSEQYGQPVHMLVSIHGVSSDRTEQCYEQVLKCINCSPTRVTQLSGHKGDDGRLLPYQDAAAILVDGKPSGKEHFGYTDGISDTYFKGSGAKYEHVIGGGKPTRGDPATLGGWEPLETGEFLLGHKDEAGEYPPSPLPALLARNGTFMVYRKLHQNVGAFNSFLDRVGPKFPGGKEALAAKFVGRWRNGAPLATFPTEQDANDFMTKYLAAQAASRAPGASADARDRYAALKVQLVGFNYRGDLDGARCPTGSHIRRVNPRGSLEFDKPGAFQTPGALDNRRRIIRRGLPYGQVRDPASDDGNHGIIMMVLNASIKRQFEFVQQQWVNYGNDFKLANDKDPILGNQGSKHDPNSGGRMVMQADPGGNKPPFLCNKIPTFVETRGGDYFFVPSLTALHLLADGVVDPT